VGQGAGVCAAYVWQSVSGFCVCATQHAVEGERVYIVHKVTRRFISHPGWRAQTYGELTTYSFKSRSNLGDPWLLPDSTHSFLRLAQCLPLSHSGLFSQQVWPVQPASHVKPECVAVSLRVKMILTSGNLG
jgi:hypothetical protein